jgi:4-methyl-5(b-hydroxyethyl)-thiazole monophosphate biosynthesis
MMKRVLLLLMEGFEEMEAVVPVDVLRRAGVEVVMASMGSGIEVTGRCGVTVHADTVLGEMTGEGFDLLVIPGGPAVKAMRVDGRARALAAAFVGRGKPVGAICAAPLVLADAGLLEGRRFTAHASVWRELSGVRGKEKVVEDGLVVTSRGAGTALEFGLALVERLCGVEKADEVREGMGC